MLGDCFGNLSILAFRQVFSYGMALKGDADIRVCGWIPLKNERKMDIQYV